MVSNLNRHLSTGSRVDVNGQSGQAGVEGAYAQCDPQFAQEWLDRSGLDITQVARVTCLSVAQVRQLLQGTDASFYSPAIRQRAYWRVMAMLGAPLPTASPQQPADPASVPPHPLQKASLSETAEQPRPPVEPEVGVTPDSARRGATSYIASVWLGLALLLGAVAVEWWRAWQVPLATPISQALPPASPPTEAAGPDTPPQEPVVVPPQVPATADAPSPRSEALVATTPVAPPCVYVAQPVTTVMPALADKPGNYVYVKARNDAEVCVIDGDRKITQLRLKAGEQRSVYGPSPWQLSALDLTQFNIYFQGWHVILPEMAAQQVALVERSR